jgi:hypothetical protein
MKLGEGGRRIEAGGRLEGDAAGGRLDGGASTPFGAPPGEDAGAGLSLAARAPISTLPVDTGSS